MSVNEVKIQKAPFELEIRGTGPKYSRTFAIGNEDHTLGNALRHILSKHTSVEFAGYSMPHPSDPIVHLRVQTVKSKEYTALQAMKDACGTLSAQCQIVLERLEEDVKEVRDDRIHLEQLDEHDIVGNIEKKEELDVHFNYASA